LKLALRGKAQTDSDRFSRNFAVACAGAQKRRDDEDEDD
jgi:hypothetical protein